MDNVYENTTKEEFDTGTQDKGKIWKYGQKGLSEQDT